MSEVTQWPHSQLDESTRFTAILAAYDVVFMFLDVVRISPRELGTASLESLFTRISMVIRFNVLV